MQPLRIMYIPDLHPYHPIPTHVNPTGVVAHSCLKATKPLICIHGVGAFVQCCLDLSSVEERMERGQQDLGSLTSSSMSFSLLLSHMGTSLMDMGFELHQSPVMISDVGVLDLKSHILGQEYHDTKTIKKLHLRTEFGFSLTIHALVLTEELESLKPLCPLAFSCYPL